MFDLQSCSKSILWEASVDVNESDKMPPLEEESQCSVLSSTQPQTKLQPEALTTVEESLPLITEEGNIDKTKIVEKLQDLSATSTLPVQFMMNEKFKNLQAQLMDTDVLRNDVQGDFKGYSKEDVALLDLYSEKKSEKIYSIYKALAHRDVESVFKKNGGVIRIGGKGTKTFLIYKKIFDRTTALTAKRASTAKRKGVRKRRTKVSTNKPLKREPPKSPRTLAGNDSAKILARTSFKTIRKLTVSGGGRVINTPKRYLDGVQTQQRSKGPHHGKLTKSKDRNVFQMGMLPPKYPKIEEKVECSNENYYLSSDAKSYSIDKSTMQLCEDYVSSNDTPNGWFEISRLQLTGELNDIISQYRENEARREERILCKEIEKQREIKNVRRGQNGELDQQRYRIQKELDALEKHLMTREKAHMDTSQMKWVWNSNSAPSEMLPSITTSEELQVAKSMDCEKCSALTISAAIPGETRLICHDCLQMEEVSKNPEKYRIFKKPTPTHIPIYATISKISSGVPVRPENWKKLRKTPNTDKAKTQLKHNQQHSLLVCNVASLPLPQLVKHSKVRGGHWTRKRNRASTSTLFPVVVLPPHRNLKKYVKRQTLPPTQTLLSKITGGKLGRKLNVQPSVIKSLNALQQYMNSLLCDRRE